MEPLLNPQEPPFSRPAIDTKLSQRLPFCIYDLFLDLPHPSASASGERSLIVDPPVTICPILSQEMCNPENIARLSKFAFPEHDDSQDHVVLSRDSRKRLSFLTSRGRTFHANLTKYDVYQLDFIAHHHTFSMLLSDGKTRVHCHVRRYLPRHEDAWLRTDVGRRRPRAMVILTRAIGGERFYSSLLKSIEAISSEATVNRKGCFATKKSPTRAFLHSIFNKHAALTTQYAELRRHGLSLNFVETTLPDGSPVGGDAACENAKRIMEENENLFKITIEKVEFGGTARRKNKSRNSFQMPNDELQFHLPFALQPGFECVPLEPLPEDIYSPIIPLLRYIGPSHFVRLLSALLCERRIILISKSVTRLSMCVRAASSMLAQGLLMWKHVMIPVLPPHMLKFLSVKAPYLVGILKQYAPGLSRIRGLSDVLLPDMLRKIPGKKSEAAAAEMLANDLDEIFQADQKLWQQDDKSAGTGNDKTVGVKAPDNSNDAAAENSANESSNKKSNLFDKLTKQSSKKEGLGAAKKTLSLAERRQGSVDAAVAFGKMIRDSLESQLKDDDKRDESSAVEDDAKLVSPKYSAPSQEMLGDIGCVEACTVAENHGGEEDIRAALTCFFVHMYGDMGMYLSETGGQFWLDRRKFLLRKKQLGEKEDSPVFLVLRKFCASQMFEVFVKGRIDDMSMTSRERSSIFPHHIPLFDVCSKYLLMNRLEFSLMNVRRIVSMTVIKCTRRIAIERSVEIRSRALALTSDTSFEGNVATALSDLVNLCRDCNRNLSIVMSVIWHRIGQTKANLWRHQLLALHLLKTLLLHGPITAITEALDGIEKIYDLRSFSNAKTLVSIREVRQTADQVYELLTDLSRLYQRRRRIALSKVEQSVVTKSKTWGDDLVKRLAFPTDAQVLHSLFCPNGITGRTYDSSTNMASSLQNNLNSLAALNRIDKSLHTPGMHTQPMYEDEIDTSSRHLDIIEEGPHREDATGSYYDDHRDARSFCGDDDLEVMSRAFSVNSDKFESYMSDYYDDYQESMAYNDDQESTLLI
eukprot:CCRYP_007890-RA/>CCRYP_007890-RA protein AED:0.06 eAED:0.06 QI:175/0.87/0.77/1/1/1/9/101/1035